MKILVQLSQVWNTQRFNSLNFLGITYDENVIVNCHETSLGTQCDLICNGQVKYNNVSINQAICNDNYNSAQWMKLELDEIGLPQEAWTIYPGHFYCEEDVFTDDEELCNDIHQSYKTSNDVIVKCSDDTCVFDCPSGLCFTFDK